MGKAWFPTNQPTILLEPIELLTLGTARNVDELAAAALLYVWYRENHRGVPLSELTVPSEVIVPWDRFVLGWLRQVTTEEMAVVNRNLEMILGDSARWVLWPLGSTSPEDVRAFPTTAFSFSVTESVQIITPILDVMDVHRRWLALPRPRPEHPLVAVLTIRQSTPDKAFVSHVKGMTSIPYVGSEVLRRSWQEDRAVTDVKLDGKPLIDQLSVMVANPSLQRRLYVDNPALVDSRGGLHLDDSGNNYPQDARKKGLPMVAWPAYRGWLRQDLWLLLAVVYGSTGAIVWTEEEGAQFLARNVGGGTRKVAAADIERWHTLIAYVASIEIWTSGKRGSRFVKLVYVYPLDHGRVSIDKPTWYSQREGRFTLTGANHWTRHIGERRRYSRLIGCMEYWLARSYVRGSSGVAPLLRPQSGKNGPGPWAPAPSDGLTGWWKWHEVLEVLMLERIDKKDSNSRKAALGRYNRIVEGLHAAGYLRHGAAGNGDVVEVETRGVKKRRVTPALRFRATARSCEAARLSYDRKWSTTTLFNWVRIPDSATARTDAERDHRQELRERRKGLTLERVEETLRRCDNNVAKAERELGVGGGSEPGSYLRGWRRRHRAG